MNKNIIIRNIYYMLSYVIPSLNETVLTKLDYEDFENGTELLAYILDITVSDLIKQGIYKEYIYEQDSLKKVKGKINITETIKNRVNNINMINCLYDELSINNIYNKIIKKTMVNLLVDNDLSIELKKKIKRKLGYFNNVELLNDLNNINWKKLDYNSTNRRCELVINICYLLYTKKINSTGNSNMIFKNFDVLRPEYIFEKFVLNFYKKHYKKLGIDANSKFINWNNTGNNNTFEEENFIKFLPNMKADIILENDQKVLIIDTKFYNQIYSMHYKATFNSNNLYQIFTYVNNYKNAVPSKKVSGMLLYAKTIDEKVEWSKLKIGENDFYVYCIDLNKDFESIKDQLNVIYSKVFL